MFGKDPRLNLLEARKRLLIAESELNRAQLGQAWRMMAEEVQGLTHRARTIGSFASMAGALLGGLFRRRESAPAAEKPSWLQTLLKGAQLVGSLWPEFSSSRRDKKATF